MFVLSSLPPSSPVFPFGWFKEPPCRFNFSEKMYLQTIQQGLSVHTQSEAKPALQTTRHRKLAQNFKGWTSYDSHQPTRTKDPSPSLWNRPHRTPGPEGHMDPGWRRKLWTPGTIQCLKWNEGPNIKHIREEPLRSHLAPPPDANCTTVTVTTCNCHLGWLCRYIRKTRRCFLLLNSA